MSFISLDTSKSQAAQVAELVADALELQKKAARVMGWANQITGGGVTPANLETTGFGFPADSGASVYAALQSIKAGADAINVLTLNSLDQG
jgi:hypothetical protein